MSPRYRRARRDRAARRRRSPGGLGLAWLGANTIRAFLFRVEPLDAATLGTAAAAILGLALAVSLKPAIDSARVDLVSTLREE